MAKANSKHMGAGTHGKSSGNGAMTNIDKRKIPDNMVLSNRDKAQHSRERGMARRSRPSSFTTMRPIISIDLDPGSRASRPH
jgi:hypothetical protein